MENAGELKNNAPKREITNEDINRFMNGHDPFERIVNILYRYNDDFVTLVYRDADDVKRRRKEPFRPFAWATHDACIHLCDGDRNRLRVLMSKYEIGVRKLSNVSIDGEVRHEFDNGYMYMFFAKRAMSQQRFQQFFKECGSPLYRDRNKEPKGSKNPFLTVTPQEQYMIETGRRYFKGYDDYDDLLKLTFDLETTGLDTDHDRINQIGIKFNRPFAGYPEGFERILTVTGDTKEDRDASELMAIDTFIKIIKACDPDIITGHNCENFDWCMLIGACKRLGYPMDELSSRYFDGDSIMKEPRESILKLGGEIETFYRTRVPGVIVTDSLHAVRRAQAIDSNFLKADLKYSTEYLGMKKGNRVYVPGKMIDTVWADVRERYAFNDKNGDWYIYAPDTKMANADRLDAETVGTKRNYIPEKNFVAEDYELKSGRYIVERYLLDDLWECEKVEYKLNTTNFLICKLLPVSYSKAVTMGTAGQWKMLMLAWSYENGLAIPIAENTGSFTGGLSRLLKTGYVDNVAKFDYNSLYPSIILTWGISDRTDLMGTMLKFLEFVLTERERYKKLKKAADKKVKAFEERINSGEVLTKDEAAEYHKAQESYSYNDKKQAQMKVLGNSFFGSYGSNNGSVFPWKSPKCAEQTTCTGRQCLRLMISHFASLGYTPIVGDSFTGDTPLFIKYDDGSIDIKPISEIIEPSEIHVDALGREYDYSRKPFMVLCRSGWVRPSYVYRHKTDKDLYEVKDEERHAEVTVTEDHSLYDSEKRKVKPSDIDNDTVLEYYGGMIECTEDFVIKAIPLQTLMTDVNRLAAGKIDRVPKYILNGNKELKRLFLFQVMRIFDNNVIRTKTCMAGLRYLEK